MHTLRISLLALASSALITGMAPAHAQLLDAIKGATGQSSSSTPASSGGSSVLGGLGGALGGGGGASMPSLSSVGTGNLTGVLSYCIQNKYVSGSQATNVQNALMGKLGGASQAKADPGYKQGLSGILGGNSGQEMNLSGGGSGGGLKQEITNKVCDQVLKYGQSTL